MIAPAGYSEICFVRRDRRRWVYRARRDSDGRSVVIKTASAEVATARDVAALRHEWEVLRDLQLPGVVHAEALERYGASLALVLDDAGPRTLAERLARGPLSLPEFLDLAVQLAEALSRLHGAHRIHRDVNPRNIVLDDTGTRATLVDFGIATTLDAIDVQSENPSHLDGTLPYLSPEQTGRTGIAVDHRTDLYALGATFYEMLTGAPPFVSDDPLEVLHAHLARRPVPVHERNRQVPRVVSDIIAKLLAKAPEDRYQGADALASDLREASERCTRTGDVAPFPLARDDVPRELHFSDRLYGRAVEVGTLLDAFARACKGEREIVLVTGEPGVGKSALLRHIQSPLTRARGLLACGKFDALQRAEPYSAVLAALRRLVKQIVSEPEPSLSTWRARIAEAVRPNGKVLANVLPELELVTGALPEVPALAPVEAAERFFVVFQRFVEALGQSGAPLVLVLDDLQWADPASLRLLEQLVRGPGERHLFLVGAYREDEVDADHPLCGALDSARGAGVAIRSIHLRPLSTDDVAQLCADALATAVERARPLAERIVRKTAGNPFFVRSLLGTLHAGGSVRFDATLHAWVWDLDAVDQAVVSDNVADLMVAALERLPPACRELLAEGACLGGSIQLGVLAGLHGQSLPATLDALWPALEEGLLIPLGQSYKLPRREGPLDESIASLDAAFRFAHDRVREAALSQLDEARRCAIDLAVGRLLLRKMSREGEGDGERLFDAVDHLNRGAKLVDDASERVRLAELDLRAGRKAKASSAHRAALAYLDHAAALLPPDAWTAYGALAYAIARERAESAYLSGDHARAEALVEDALVHAPTRADALELWDLRVVALTVAGDYAGALARGREALALAGEALPTVEDAAAAAEHERAAVMRLLAGRPVDVLLDLPPMRDDGALATTRLLVDLIVAAFACDPPLWSFLTARAASLSAQRGCSTHCPYAFAVFGLSYGDATGDWTTAQAFGEVAVTMARRSGDPVELCRTLVVAGHFENWKVPRRASVATLGEALRVGLESGELQYAAYATTLLSQVLFSMGVPIADVLKEVERGLALSATQRNRLAIELHVPVRQAARCLLGRTRSPSSFEDSEFEEARFVKTAAPIALGLYETLRLQCANVLGDLEGARRAADASSPRLPFMAALFALADQAFHAALAYAASCDAVADGERADFISRVCAGQAKLAAWAEGCPQNFAHKRDLVGAELARLTGDLWTAEGLYERAIEAAREQCFVHDEALAEELAARFHLAHGRRRFAKMHLEGALRDYDRWGATAKVEALRRAHRDLLSEADLLPVHAMPSTPPGSQSVAGFDSLSLLKATQAISSEMVLERVLERLLRLVLESAGAERAALLLEEKGTLTVFARATVLEGVSLERAPLGSDWPQSVIRYVWRAGEPTVLGDAQSKGPFADDPCVCARGIRSILCVPVQRHGRSVGVVYLDNAATPYAFTGDRVEVVRHLAAQLAISMENAQLLRRMNDAVRARDDFLTLMAHELRTPLTPLFLQLGTVRAIVRALGPDAAAQANAPLEAARLQLDRLSELVERLLDISRVASGQLSVMRARTDLVDVVRDVIARLEPELERAGSTVTQESRGPVIGTWDRQRLEQVVSNLLSNAMKFGAGSPIEVTVESVDNVARLSVQDHGVGIAPEDQERIFRQFERAVSVRHYGGFGVGLWVARQVVEAHGGTIRVESKPGAGARFIVELPKTPRGRTR